MGRTKYTKKCRVVVIFISFLSIRCFIVQNIVIILEVDRILSSDLLYIYIVLKNKKVSYILKMTAVNFQRVISDGSQV